MGLVFRLVFWLVVWLVVWFVLKDAPAVSAASRVYRQAGKPEHPQKGPRALFLKTSVLPQRGQASSVPGLPLPDLVRVPSAGPPRDNELAVDAWSSRAM